MIVQESAYKTPVTLPVVFTTASTYNSATAYYVRLDGGNAFTMRPKPVEVEVPYGGGVAVGAYRVSDKQACEGELTVKLCASQAPFLLAWATNRINSLQTLPWPTTLAPGDLASCSVYHAIQRSDGSYKRRVYLGTKVSSVNVEVSEESTVVTLKLGLVSSTPQGNQFDASTDPTATVFPAPVDANFPSDVYLWTHSSGLITIGGTIRSQITELRFDAKNTLAKRFFNSRFVEALLFTGRKTTCGVKLLYAPTPDDRTTYEGLTSQAISVGLNNGTHSVTITLNAQNIFDTFNDDLPLNDLYFQASSLANLWDPVAGSDFVVSWT